MILSRYNEQYKELLARFPQERLMVSMRKQNKNEKTVLQSVLFLIVLVAFFSLFAIPMGLSNMLNTMMNTAYRLLMDTAFYIMAIAVIAGAFSVFKKH